MCSNAGGPRALKYGVTREYVTNELGFKGYGCGLCQTGVPCESKIPTREDLY